MHKFLIEFTEPEMHLLSQALGNLPYAVVHQLIAKVQAQYDAQLLNLNKPKLNVVPMTNKPDEETETNK